MEAKGTGRPPRFCSSACRQKAYRQRVATRSVRTGGEDWELHTGDAIGVLRRMDAHSVQTVVTSPPYFNLRDYDGQVGQIGLESSPDEYVATLVRVFRDVARVLSRDGVLWVNIGDTYAGHANAGADRHGGRGHRLGVIAPRVGTTSVAPRKSLLGIPWKLALALQKDGWILRNEIIWHKPNGTPESVSDRLTRRHEHLFMLTRSRSYFFDLDAIRDEKGSSPGDVWRLSTRPSKASHFAMYPIDLPLRCIAAASRTGDIVLDPFSGMATTGCAALELDRRYIGIDLSDRYNQEAAKRLGKIHPRLPIVG